MLGSRECSCSTTMGLSWWWSLAAATLAPRPSPSSRWCRAARATAVVIFVPPDAPGDDRLTGQHF